MSACPEIRQNRDWGSHREESAFVLAVRATTESPPVDGQVSHLIPRPGCVCGGSLKMEVNCADLPFIKIQIPNIMSSYVKSLPLVLLAVKKWIISIMTLFLCEMKQLFGKGLAVTELQNNIHA